MKLIEADGKRLLKEAGIEVPAGVFLSLDATAWPAGAPWPGPVYVKSQVLQGRRGKLGLLRRCARPDGLPAALDELRQTLGAIPCAGFLCEPECATAAEWFLSVDYDRAAAEPRVAVTAMGGANVFAATSFAARDFALQKYPPEIKDVIRRLLQLAEKNDAWRAEINPLAERVGGGFVALDAKIELDDAAAFRHPEWKDLHVLPALGRAATERERAYDEFLKQAGHRGTFGRYLELDGDVALILSGGGASLLALDAMRAAGGRAANYLEVSGNPEPESLREAAKIVLSKPGLRGVWIAGSFANFTDIQATCGAVLRAVDDLGLVVPIVIRRDGPNADAALRESLRWSASHGVPLVFHRADTSLEDSARVLLSKLI